MDLSDIQHKGTIFFSLHFTIYRKIVLNNNILKAVVNEAIQYEKEYQILEDAMMKVRQIQQERDQQESYFQFYARFSKTHDFNRELDN